MFFLVAIPLFPSEAPDFINQSIVTKFWELVHLLFIGIAVSYGLFCRRNVDLVESGLRSGDSVDSQSYVSRMFHVSSIFEDECGDSVGFDEKRANYRRSSVIGERSKVGSGNVENECERPSGGNGESVVQAWNSQYFQHESMVFVDQPNCALESGSIVSHRPLGLPVRSLKSRVRDPDKPELVSGSQSRSNGRSLKSRARNLDRPELVNGNQYSSSNGRILKSRVRNPDKPELVNGSQYFSSNGNDQLNGFFDMSRNGDFGDPGSLNELEASPSPIPWRSRSGSEVLTERTGGSTRPSHFRPLSVDETQFESLKSRSVKSTASSSSQSSSMSNSPIALSPPHSNGAESPNLAVGELGRDRSSRRSFPPTSPSVPSDSNGKATALSSSQSSSVSHSPSALSPPHSNGAEPPNLAVGELGRERCSRKSYPPTSPSIPTDLSGMASRNAVHTRQKSCGSVLDRPPKRPFEDVLQEFCSSRKEDSPNLDAKPESVSKPSLRRGRSVRTFRSLGATPHAKEAGEKHGFHARRNASSRGNEVEGVYAEKSEPETRGLGYLSSAGFSRQNVGGASGDHDTEKQKCSENSDSDSGEDSDSESMDENIEVNEEAASETANDSEVDKKAGEFIAKFREQIRRQKKSSSIGTPRDIDISGNFFR